MEERWTDKPSYPIVLLILVTFVLKQKSFIHKCYCTLNFAETMFMTVLYVAQ